MKKGGCSSVLFVIFIPIIAIVLIISILISLGILGIGTGVIIGTNESTDKNNSISEQETNTEAVSTVSVSETTKVNKVSINITIDGRDYIYNNKKMNLEELMTEINKNDEFAEICISCESTATVNAKESLMEALESNGFKKVSVK